MQRGLKFVLGAGLAATVILPSFAFAGGFESPDNGAEVLGRGGTFTAKADSPIAVQYNVAGLARLRGTRIELDGNFDLESTSFQRAGVYPGDPTDAQTPYAGQAFPKVKNKGGIFTAPGLYATTDFGYFDRWTFGLSIYGPSSVGNRSFPGTVTGTMGTQVPSPSRYDITKENLLIFYPTFSASVRATKWLDIGLAVHVVYSHFDLSSVAFTPIVPNRCMQAEYAPCDAALHIKSGGTTATASLGLQARPKKYMSFGLNLRAPTYMSTKGTVSATAPAVAPAAIDPGKVTFKTNLPWVLRLGARYMFLKEDGFEQGDLEIDGSYEAWHAAQGSGPKLSIPELSIFSDINSTIIHHFIDTYSIRVGGSFNHRINPKNVFSFRAGIFYDSAATKDKDTRLDFSTAAKLGLTIGVGYRWTGLTINLAYAYMYSPDRLVTNGDVSPINGTNGTNADAAGNQYPATNNGQYHTSTQVIAVNLTFVIEDFMKNRKRVIKYE